MDADTMVRVRRVLDALAMPEGVSPASRHVREMAGTVAMPALIALAEAVGRLAGVQDWSWRETGPADEVDQCVACLESVAQGVTGFSHAPDCPALAIDAALAELAALYGGEVGE